ncbi:peptidase family A16 [Oesophagostomum dentatum]|uniref:Peptidase family A16 n=1 Tax=Oesophagostomum dentatum TaxID=61180 RepID=A0A0B1SH69_OESDE|nr:peptidase family A16 [Oesophagostomum dentatum]
MSAFGSVKAQLTKAANALRQKVAEVDGSILEPLVPVGDLQADAKAVQDRKRQLFTMFSIVDRALSSLRSRLATAEQFAQLHADESGDFPLLPEIHSHWETGGMDQLAEEAEELLVRLDAAIKLLPASEAVFRFSGLSVAPMACDPNLASSPTSSSNVPNSQTPHRPMSGSVNRSTAFAVNASLDPNPLVTATGPRRPSGIEDQQQQHAANSLPIGPVSPTQQTVAPSPLNRFRNHSNPVSNNSPLGQISISATERPFKLPALNLPEFHGDVEAFPEFWDMFTVAVHENTSVPQAYKFIYLKSCLKGSASDIIANFASTAENYEDAVRTLLNTYCRPEILKSRLWDKLLEQRASTDSALSQRSTLCAIRAIWSQMKRLNEDSASTPTLKIIRSKFPKRTREKVGELKSKGDSTWTVDELLKALDTVVDQLEVIEDADPTSHVFCNTDSSVRLGSRSTHNQFSGYSRSPSRYRSPPTRYNDNEYRSPTRYDRSRRSPTPRCSPRSRSSPTSGGYRCAFCLCRGHDPSTCMEAQTPQERRTAVINQGLCWLCLSPNHMWTECSAPECAFCGRPHHTSLCMKRQSAYRRSRSSPQARRSPRTVQPMVRARRSILRNSTRGSRSSFPPGASPDGSPLTSRRNTPSPNKRVSFSEEPHDVVANCVTSTCAQNPCEYDYCDEQDKQPEN